MENNIRERLNAIIEQSNEKPACKNCVHYKNGGCSHGCVNEQLKITTPNYSCDNHKAVYEFNEDTVDALKDLLESVKRVEKGMKNLDLLINGKITEKDFIDLVD